MPIPWARCYAKCRDALRSFARARDGNVAITFAILLVPILAAAGAAIDYSRANSVRADMQAALDSTALMLSKEAATDTASQLQTNATAYFKAAFNRPYTQDITVSASYSTTNGPTVVVNGSVSVPTTLMGIFGYNAITVSSSSTTAWGTSRLRVALVLDNTGSMNDSGKLSALKTATKNLLSQLQSAATTDGDVYVSIIPFVKDVNIDKSNYAANWIDWTDWNANNGNCSGYKYSLTGDRPTTSPSVNSTAARGTRRTTTAGTAVSPTAATPRHQVAATTTPTWWRPTPPSRRRSTPPSSIRRARRRCSA